MSDPAKTLAEANERHERAHEGPRWVPVIAALLAVLAAVSGYFGNLRSTQALFEKNEAIVATTESSDKYAEYQAERLKYYVLQTALDQGVNAGGHSAKLQAAAKRENAKTSGPRNPRLAAEAFKEKAKEHNVRSEQLLKQHETIEVATTLFEVSIVLVSITTLVGSRLLPAAAGLASLIGVIFFVAGFRS